MKNVASILFSNMSAVQDRVAMIESKLKAFSAPVRSAPAKLPAIHSTRSAQRTDEVKPFFPKDLAYALRGKTDTSATTDPKSSVSTGYDDLINDTATKNGVDPNLVKAVVKAESGFKSDAVSRTGAQGLMQLMPSTSSALGVSDPFDPAQNIEAGTKYLKSRIDKFGSTELALAAYNSGPGNVVKYGGVPPFTETKNYVSRVMGYLNDMQNGN